MGRVYRKRDGDKFKWYASRQGKSRTRVFELGQTDEVTLERLLQGFRKIMDDEIREEGGLTRHF